MPEVGERLDKVEGRLGGVEGRLGSVEGRLGGVEERLGGVEERLGSVETGLKDVREEVGGLHGEVGGLRGEVSGLRILGEKNADDIRKIAEVQAHHGKKLDDITQALAPLARIDAFVTAVAHEHEQRIKALEKHTGLQK